MREYSVGGISLSVNLLDGFYPFLRFITPALLLVFFYLVLPPLTRAAIVPDQGRGGKEHLGTPSGGIPVLEINAPTAGGVSRNSFLEFNVDQAGLIVNNLNLASYHPEYRTILSGGHVEFNRNLGTGGPARIILNEVTSGSATAIRGNTEIYGHKADYIVANPNGITCNGCGFINTGRISLITGSANMLEGEVASFNLSPTGILKIDGVGREGFGLYAPSEADLVSNAIRIAGSVYAGKELAVLSGNAGFDYRDKSVSSSAGSTAAVAVDSAALGGMRAESIRILATQKGFGINLAGDVTAEAGRLEIMADGGISFKNAAARDIQAASASGDARAQGGEVHAQNLTIRAGRDVAVSSRLSVENSLALQAGRDLTAGGALLAEDIEISAAQDLSNQGEIRANSQARLEAGRSLSNAGSIQAIGSLRLSAGGDLRHNSGGVLLAEEVSMNAVRDLTNQGEIRANHQARLEAGRSLSNTGSIKSAGKLRLAAGGGLSNGSSAADASKSVITAGGGLHMSAGGELKNIGGIEAGGDALLEALDLFNYARILANGDLYLEIGRDLINFRGSAILTGGDLAARVARDLVNYKAEIYALGSMTLAGRNDVPAAPSQAAGAPESRFDNPYIAPAIVPVPVPPAFVPVEEDTEEEADTTYRLNIKKTLLTLPYGAFPEDAAPGMEYIHESGYIFIVGEEKVEEKYVDNPAYLACMAAGTCAGNEPAKIVQRTISYSGTDSVTIKDAVPDAEGLRPTLAYTVVMPEEEPAGETPPPPPIEQTQGEIPVQDNGGVYADPLLTAYAAPTLLQDYAFEPDLMSGLLNWAGRIEAGGDISIAAGSLNNRGVEINAGNPADIAMTGNSGKACKGTRVCGWRETGRFVIKATKLDSAAAVINAGGDLLLKGRSIINQSSMLAARDDLAVKTDELINQTYSEVVNLQVYMARRYFKKKGFSSSWHNEYATWLDQKRVYSKQRSTIVAGDSLKIAAGSIRNDQSMNPLAGLGIASAMPQEVKSRVTVSLRLPEGHNGLFHVTPHAKYLVQTNASFINPDSFAGSSYFFENLGQGTPRIDAMRILGDPAYETRLVMDAILKATQRHYLDYDGLIGSDAEQMRALYEQAALAAGELNLRVGVALTPEQTAALRQDIIWYVEKKVDGYKVLVPELYLAQATLDSLDPGRGSLLAGREVDIEAERMDNYGAVAAYDNLRVKARELTNESNDKDMARLHADGAVIMEVEGHLNNLSAEISGQVAQIKAGELNNLTKALSEDRMLGKSEKHRDIFHVEETAATALISGTDGLLLEIINTLYNAGAEIRSELGHVAIQAQNAVFDTVQIYNSATRLRYSSRGYKNTTSVDAHESIRHARSNISAGKDLILNLEGAMLNMGSKLAAKGNLNIQADVILAKNVEDVERHYHHDVTQRFSFDPGEFVRGFFNGSLLSTLTASITQQLSSFISTADANDGIWAAAGAQAASIPGGKLGESVGKSIAGLGYGVVELIEPLDKKAANEVAKAIDFINPQQKVKAFGQFRGATIGYFVAPMIKQNTPLGKMQDTLLQALPFATGLFSGLAIGLADGLSMKQTVKESEHIARSNVQASFEGRNINMTAGRDIDITGRLNAVEEIKLMAGAGGAGRLFLSSAADSVEKSFTEFSVRTDLDTKNPLLDMKIKFEGSYAGGGSTTQTLAQTRLEAAHVSLGAADDVEMRGVALQAGLVDIFSLNGDVREGDFKTTDSTWSADARGKLSLEVETLKAMAKKPDSVSRLFGSLNNMPELIKTMVAHDYIKGISLRGEGALAYSSDQSSHGSSIRAGELNISARDFIMEGSSIAADTLRVRTQRHALFAPALTEHMRVNAGLSFGDNIDLSVKKNLLDAQNDIGLKIKDFSANLAAVNHGSSVQAGHMDVQAGQDITLWGSALRGGQLTLEAGRFLNLLPAYDLRLENRLTSPTLPAAEKTARAGNKIKKTSTEPDWQPMTINTLDINVEPYLQYFLGDGQEPPEYASNLQSIITESGIKLPLHFEGEQSLTARPSSISGRDIRTSSGLMTSLISSRIQAENTAFVDAGQALLLAGLPEHLRLYESLDVQAEKSDQVYTLNLAGRLGYQLGAPAPSAIEAGGGLSGRANLFIGLFNGQMDSANFSSSILPGILPLPLALDAGFGQHGAGGSLGFDGINARYDRAAGTLRLHTPFADFEQQGTGGSLSFNNINAGYDHASGAWRLRAPFFDLRGGTRP
ncbi:MAG: filamentous hemagglutinin N-terminal domain-containing protein [Deltaproteobacteria bacterium]|jgi:filamentous hemagglutinin family protein|nr:filamentous hemagglutinin N-terminal domain-containing protein [Deltaproteobacteria bacterium]